MKDPIFVILETPIASFLRTHCLMHPNSPMLQILNQAILLIYRVPSLIDCDAILNSIPTLNDL